MIRGLLAALLIWTAPVAAQDFSGLARVDMAQSQLRDEDGALLVELALSQTVPFRVFTVDAPRRLVLDFKEVDWTGVTAAALRNSDLATDLRFGVLRPGWSRLVVDLAAPLVVRTAGLAVNEASGVALLTVTLDPADAAAFAARAGEPQTPGWTLSPPPAPALLPQTDTGGPLVVVVDPGHGGLDPGAERGDVQEADIMLALGIELADALNRTEGIRAILTREADIFVPLEERMSIARANRADLFISLHMDALRLDDAQGASVYTMNEEGTDSASQRMAERHERGDLLAGLDLSGQDDRIATVLMDLARLESAPRGLRFADKVVVGLRDAGARLNSRPRREGRLAVLNAADFPSVLIEVGFLSNDTDRANMLTVEGRDRIVRGIVQAVQVWAVDEAVRAPFVRQ